MRARGANLALLDLDETPPRSRPAASAPSRWRADGLLTSPISITVKKVLTSQVRRCFQHGGPVVWRRTEGEAERPARTGALADGSRGSAAKPAGSRHMVIGIAARAVSLLLGWEILRRCAGARRLDGMSGAMTHRARREAEARLAEQPRRLAHVRGVAGAAERLSRRFDADTADRLVAASWLHDIGYAPSVRRTGFHPLDGAEFARLAGFGELVASLVAFHTGAHVEASERRVSGLSAFSGPPRDVLDALTFCDLMTGPDGTPVSAEGRLRDVLARYGPQDPVHRAVVAGREELLAAVGRVRCWL